MTLYLPRAADGVAARRWARRGLLLHVALTAALVYLASASVGALVAYDPGRAWLRFATIVLGLALCAALWQVGRLRRSWGLEAVSIVAGPVALGLGILGRVATPHLTAALAEAIAILLPLQAGGAILAYRQGRRLLAELLGAGLLLNGWLLILSGERSVWLAAGIGLASAILMAGNATARDRNRRWRWAGFLWAGALGLLGVLYLWMVVWPASTAGVPLLSTSALAERTGLWRAMMDLAADYRFTGSGLGMTAMVASSYLFLLHVPLYYHAHQMLVQIALEQGVPGVVGFGGMAVVTLGMAQAVYAANDEKQRVLGVCALAALITLLVHGLLDSELYASALLPLLFVPFGCLWGLYAAQQEAAGARPIRAEVGGGIAWTALGAALCIALWVALGGRSAWAANLVAVAQTRAELSVYAWPQWALQDQVRRSPAVNLEPALAAYRAALAQDATNVTAHRRLGQIALARGEIALAQQHLVAAYAVAPHDRVVRQLLGETAALAGDLPAAVRLWQGIDLGQDQLDIRLAWYQLLDHPQDWQRMQEAIDLYERGLALP